MTVNIYADKIKIHVKVIGFDQLAKCFY